MGVLLGNIEGLISDGLPGGLPPPPDSGGGSTNTNLSVFTVDGADVTDGQTVNKINGTTSVTVVATPQDPSATVGTITGDTGLSTGDNALSFTVTAADGVTTRDYHLTLHVVTAGLPEITDFGFNGASSGGTFGGQGFAFSTDGTRYGVWFNADSGNSQPNLGAGTYFQVDVSGGDDATTCAGDAYSVLSFNGFNVSSGGTSITLTSSIGPQPDATSSTGDITVGVSQQGVDPS